MLVPTLTYLVCIFAATTVLADLSPVKRAASPYSKLSAADLDKQARKEMGLIQTKLTQKVSIVKGGNGGGKGGNVGMMMKRTFAKPWLSQRQVGISTLTASYYDMLWGVPFQIVNGKKSNLAWDTGSSLTIFNHDAYTPSPLAQKSGLRVSIAYMDGTAGTGDVYFDYITVAGLTMWTSLVWADTKLLPYEFDGILGVGFANGIETASLIEAMVQNFTMLNDVVCMTMTSQSDGVLQFGALDATIVNEIMYTDVLARHSHAWDTTASINGIAPFDVIIDTGTSFAMLPTKVAEELFKKLGLKTLRTNAGPGTPDILWGLCPKGGPPPLSIKIGNINTPFTVSAKNAEAWNRDDCRLSFFGNSELDKSNLAIFGSAFLKNVHFVMDRGLYKMGFAQRILRSDEK